MRDKLREIIARESFLIILLIIFVILMVCRRDFIQRLPRLIDLKTIGIIFIFMALSKCFEESKTFQKIAILTIRRFYKKPKIVIILLITLVSISAMFIMNDCSVIMFTPLAVYVSDILEIDRALTVTGLAAGANIGSTLTPIGNPQNIIIWRESEISFVKFCIITLPLVILLLVFLNVLMLTYLRRISYRSDIILRRLSDIKSDINVKLLLLASILLIVDVVLTELHRVLISIIITIISILVVDYRILKKVDYSLILLFILIFADFGEFSIILKSFKIFTLLTSSPLYTYIISVVISQFISNVPATIVFINEVIKRGTLAALLYGVNVGGLGTTISSLANLIAIRLSCINSKSYYRYAMPIFAISIPLGLMVMFGIYMLRIGVSSY